MTTYEQSTTIFIPEKDIIKYEESSFINSFNKNVPIKLLIDLLENEKYFRDITYFLENDIDELKIKGLNKKSNIISFNKLELFEALKKLLSNYDDKLSSKFKRKYNKVANYLTLRSFWDHYKDEKYSKLVNKKIYLVNVIDIINFLVMSNEDYYETIRSKKYNDIPIEVYAYIIYSFFQEYNIMKKYVFPEKINKRIINLLCYKDIDFEHLDVLNYSYKDSLNDIKIDPDIEKQILDGINPKYSDIEKAIFVYIKMCKLFSYSDEYYATEQKGLLAKKHRNIKNLNNININNTEVVCYEFNVIYAKMLAKLNINFEFAGDSDISNYGSGHAYLKFKSGKYIVIADAVISIITSDMMSAKLNSPLIGLKSINSNVKTQKRFKLLLNKVYLDIARNEQVLSIEEPSLDKAIEEYEEIANPEPIDLKTKFKIMLEKISTSNFQKLEAISYICILKSVLFTEVEKDKNIDIKIVRKNSKDKNNPIRSIAIITLNYDDVRKNRDNNIYYIYDPKFGLYNVTESEIIKMLKQNKIKEIYGNTILNRRDNHAK